MPRPTIVIELKALQDRAGEAAKFLKSKVQGDMKSKGTRVLLEGARTKEVKLLLHKFLHHQGLVDYRVLSQAGILEVTRPERHAFNAPGFEGTAPTASQTTPYLFPQTPTLTPLKKRKTKAKKSRK